MPIRCSIAPGCRLAIRVLAFDWHKEGCVLHYRQLLVTSILLLSDPLVAANIVGSDEDEQLYGSDGTDFFYGGGGADTFVINHLSDEPDEIIDFNPDEGDRIKLTLPGRNGFSYDRSIFSLDRKGILKMRMLNSENEVAVVNTRRTDLTLDVNKRKGEVLFTFKVVVGQ